MPLTALLRWPGDADRGAACPAVVLVAEEDPEIRDLLHWLLDDAGYRPVLATDGSEALAPALQGAPALILLT
jgi:CheY-like chemotaxis protein